MFRIKFSDKSIAVIIFAIPIIGLLTSLSNSFYVANALKAVDVRLSQYYDAPYFSNHFIDFAAYILLIAGGLIYVRTRYREIRLIRFVIAFVMFIHGFYLLLDFLYIISFSATVFTKGALLNFAFSIVTSLLWIWISYQILRFLKTRKPVETETVQYGDERAEVYVHASTGQRFVNYLADMLLRGLAIYIMVKDMILAYRHGLFENDETDIRIKATYIGLALLSIIYFIAFEFALGATPGKYLTETQVLTYDGDKPDFKTIIGRTFSRFVPFEPFSFLGNYNWHDRWSNSVVVKDKPSPVAGAYYLLIMPALLVTYFAGVNASGFYQQYKKNKLQKDAVEAAYTYYQSRLKELTPENYLELAGAGSMYYTQNDYLYLKTEKVNGDQITFRLVKVPVSITNSPDNISRCYQQQKDTAARVTFNRQQLEQAYKTHVPEDGVLRGITVKGYQYFVSDIRELNTPDLRSDYGSSGTFNFSVGIINKGASCTITDVKVEDGDVKLTSVLPLNVPNDNYRSGGVRLEGTTEGNTDYIIDITVQDSAGKKQVYEARGNTRDFDSRSLVRIK